MKTIKLTPVKIDSVLAAITSIKDEKTSVVFSINISRVARSCENVMEVWREEFNKAFDAFVEKDDKGEILRDSNKTPKMKDGWDKKNEELYAVELDISIPDGIDESLFLNSGTKLPLSAVYTLMWLLPDDEKPETTKSKKATNKKR